MFSLIAYPLDVITTNRIARGSLFQATGENLPKEFVTLYERGALNRGLYRGLLPGLIYTMYWKEVQKNARDGMPALSVILGTLTLNPLAVMQTKRQIITSQTMEPSALYRDIMFKGGLTGVAKLFTLGLGAHIFRNFAMSLAFLPRQAGSEDFSVQALYGLGAILASHPFEVARVLIIKNEGEHLLRSTLKQVWETEGFAGLYRGFIPRTIHCLPPILALNYFIEPRDSWIIEPRAGFSEKQGGVGH